MDLRRTRIYRSNKQIENVGQAIRRNLHRQRANDGEADGRDLAAGRAIRGRICARSAGPLTA
jgi:hypothetical protein